MDSVLVVVKLATSDYGLSQAVYKAHQLAHNELYLVDFPGLDNPRWAERRDHVIGRFALIYGKESFCVQVQNALEPLRQQATPNQGFATMLVGVQALRAVKAWNGVATARVHRHALRKAGDKAAEKVADRLRAKFAREGRTPATPIVERPRFTVDAQGRWGAILDPGTPKQRVVKSVLRLPSSSGNHFANALTRESSTAAPFFGRRDSYGFSARNEGASVPKVEERVLLAAMIGEDESESSDA